MLRYFSVALLVAGCSCSEEDGASGSKPDAGDAASPDAAPDATIDAPADAGADAETDAGSDAADASDATAGWTLPGCTSVTGTDAVTFTLDQGATLAPTPGTLTGTVYTKGLVALDAPNVLLAASGASLLRSEDAGCNWATVAALPSSLMLLAKSIGDRAYGWVDNDQPLVRIDGTTVTALKNPVQYTLGLAADATDPDRVRLGGSDGSLWESLDAGATWNPIGTPPVSSSLLLAYRFVFDPNDLDHVLFGSATTAAHVSFDGGKTWAPSAGFSGSGKANVFELAVSPANGQVVWAEGIDLDENLDGGTASEGRHIWRSTDGGLSFSPVVDHQPGTVTLTNGLLLAPHPTNDAVVYFEFGTYFQGYGTDLFRYDAAVDQLTHTHNSYDDMLALAFSPADPSVIYLGITSEDVF